MAKANDSGAAGTTLDAATMRAIRGSVARLALVRAVRDGGLITTETDWIDRKARRIEASLRHRSWASARGAGEILTAGHWP